MRGPAALLGLLGALLLTALAGGCGGGSETVTVVETAPPETLPTEPDGGIGTTPEEPEGEADDDGTGGGSPQSLESFQTPSGNIACVVGDDGARCDIADRSWNAPRPAGCPAEMDYGQGLAVSDEDDGPGTVVCAGDTTMNPQAPVLGYGESTSVGDFTCTSEEAGVTCLDDGDGRGFFISKQSYRLF